MTSTNRLVLLSFILFTSSVQASFSESYTKGEKTTCYDDGRCSSENYHTYTRWDGVERPFEELNIIGGTGYYYPSENVTHYDLVRLDERLSLPKNFANYTFDRTKISFKFTVTPAQLGSRSIANGSGQWYILIPDKATQKRFLWDNKKPIITNESGATLDESNYWYSVVNNQIRLNYNQVARNFGIASINVTFLFDSWEICGSGCDATWSGNVTLDNTIIRRCDNTKVTLQYAVSDYWSRWDFCENTGTTVYDENATTNHNGVFQNQASWNTSGGINFDGVDDYIKLPGGDFDSAQYQGTIITDAYVKTIGGTAYATVRNSMFGQPSGGDNAFGFAAGTNIPVFRGGIGGNVTGNTTVANGTRHTFKVTWDNTPSYTQKLYLDDVLIANTTVTLGWQGGTGFNSTIGRVYTSSTSGSFNGTIHRVGVWRRSLNSTEIADAFRYVASGNVTAWKDVGANNETYQIDVNASENYNVSYRQNQTGNMVLLGSNQSGNNSYALSTKYQDTEVNITLYNNSNNSELVKVKFWSQAVAEDGAQGAIPPDPINLAQTNSSTGFWINYTWQNGTGNITNSYNASVNGTWTNGSANNFSNGTIVSHGWRNITVWAFNSSGNGNLSTGSVTQNTQIPNNAPNISVSNQTISEGQSVYIQLNSTDIDSDNLTYSINRTDLFADFNSTTGKGNRTMNYSEAGIYYIDAGVSDNYTAIANYTFTITVNNIPLNISSFLPAGDPSSIQGVEQRFNVTLNRTANVTWLINGTQVQYNSSVTIANYSNSTAGVRTYNVTANVNESASSDTDTHSWNWIVSASGIATFIPPAPILCVSVNGTTFINLSCSAGVGNVTDGMNFTNINLSTSSNGTAFFWNNTGLSSNTLYEYRVFAFNNSGTGTLSLTYATVTNTTIVEAAVSSFIPPVPVNLTCAVDLYYGNCSWSPGSGNVSNSYNVSVNNTFTNSSAAWLNASTIQYGWLNFSIWSWNSSVGNISSSALTVNLRTPNSTTGGGSGLTSEEHTWLENVNSLYTCFFTGSCSGFTVNITKMNANVTSINRKIVVPYTGG